MGPTWVSSIARQRLSCRYVRSNNEMKLTRSAQHSVARPSQLISVFCGLLLRPRRLQWTETIN